MPAKIIIGVAGARGSFSEEAAVVYAREEGVVDYKIVYLINVDAVMNALNGKIDLGIFPIENSNGGVVIETVRAMSQYVFNIKKMFEIDVKHCLLAKKGVKPAEIMKIISHPQALKQCRMYLKKKWGNIYLQEYSDTAEAAKDLASGELDERDAVIAPKQCAKLYNLNMLEEEIQDLKFNYTTFIAATQKLEGGPAV